MRRLSVLLGAAAAVALAAQLDAGVLLSWNIPNASNETSVASTGGAAGYSGSLTMGSVYAPTDFRVYDFSGYSTQDTTSFADAQTKNAYFAISITPASGEQMTIDSLEFDKVISQNQGRTFYLTSSVDGYASILNTYVSPDTQTFAGPTIAVAGFSGLTSPVTFRWYVQGKGAYEAVGFGDGNAGQAIAINGTTVAVPEPAVLSVIVVAGLMVVGRRKRA